MSESYDSFADIGEPHRMAPEGVITDENIEQLTQLATAPISIEGQGSSVEIQVQEVEDSNQMEATIKEKVNRKKQRSEKQKATFEKARQKR